MAKLITVEKFDEDKKISFGSIEHTITTEENDAKKVTVAGIGTFDWNAGAAQATFVADSALSGEIGITTSDPGDKVLSADFSKASGVKFTGTAGTTDITGGAGNDTLIGDAATTDINAGAGNDSVKIVAGATTTVTLGAGADTLDISAVTGTGSKVFDYNYFEGDVIKVGTGDGVTLNAEGEASVGTGNKIVADKVAIQDNWYGVKISDGAADVDYFTAVNNNNLTVTKDLSNSVIANVVNASGAKNANITLGHGTDNVTLTSGVDTVKVGKSAGNNITDIASDDVIAIDGVKLSDISLAAGTNAADSVAVNYAASTVETGVATAGGSLNFNDGSKTHKLRFDNLTTGGNITYATASDADWFIGATNNGTTLEVGDTTHLHETDKYKNITKIKVATGLKLNAPISLTGATGKANTIDASTADAGNAVAVWGYSSADDTIKLNPNGKAQDNIWFGAKDGKDTVDGFAYGTASDSDVLYLKDTKTLNDINVSINAGNALFTVSKNDVLTMNTVAAAGDNNVVQIKLANEKLYRVAGNVEAADTVTVDTDTTDDLNFYAFDKTQDQTVSLKGGKDWVVHSLYTDCYTAGATIGTIDASAATGNVTLAASANIKGGKGTSNIWTYQSDASAAVTAGTGTDIIWFAENADKDVTVTNFTAGTDVVKFATAQSLKEIAEGYTFASAAAGKATITGATNADSQLILDADGTINLVDGSDKAYKAMVTTTGSVTFSADVNIYAGMAALEASKDFEGTVKVRVGTKSRGISSDDYFIDDKVTTFDATKSTATFWIAGNSEAATTIKGGQTENVLYGGGAASDVLFGSVVAKDTFYFGEGDGVDEIKGGVDKEDTICLWNVADADIANVKVTVNEAAGTATIYLRDTSALNISDSNAAAAIGNGLTFTSASQTAYTYDSESKTLVKKA